MKKFIIGSLVAALALVSSSVMGGQASAATAYMSIGGATGTVGDSFTVLITENGGDDSINTVEADMVISDSSKLQVTNVAYVGPFSQMSVPCGASFCAVAGMTGEGVTGTQTIAAVTLKTIAAGN